ncbi:MAG: hypothetical protein SVV80_13870, partial [Planctomycetota bacterium]|nr:hypothetical protein [Planctomycetota bacterium]
LMNTLWTTQRLLCDIEDFALVLGGAWFNNPEADTAATVESFVKMEFGISRAGRVASKILKLCATVPPGRDVFLRMLGTLPARCGKNWHPTEFETIQADDLAGKTAKLGRFFKQTSSRVRKNRKKFDNFLLACDIIGWACRLYIACLRGLSGPKKRKLHTEGKNLLQRILKDWDRRRYRRSENKPAYYEDLANTLVQNVQKAVNRLSG